MTLPDPLLAWKEQLAPMAKELQEGLLPWLQRLDLAIGPMVTEDLLAEGDPDGFLGLSRRGPYERLLLSEWLLASEVPDEFLRRAAGGEHAFLELSRRSGAQSRVAAALFDAGPSQIGAPRLVHLALLFVLERRARLAGATFFWGVLQQPWILRESVAQDQVLQLLAARTRQEVTQQQVDEVLAASPLRRAYREVWIIGGSTACSLAPGPCVEVVEPISSACISLLARLRRADRSTLSVELPLPSEARQIRLLRNLFERPAPPRKNQHALNTGRERYLFFSGNGRRLLVGCTGGGCLAYPVPNSPFQPPPGAPTTILPPAGWDLRAAGWEGNHGILLLQGEGRLVLQTVGRKGGKARPDRVCDGQEVVGGEGSVVALHTVVAALGRRVFAFLTSQKQYVRVDAYGKVRTRWNVVAMGKVHAQTLLACRSPREGRLFFEIEQARENVENIRLKTTVTGEIGLGVTHPGPSAWEHWGLQGRSGWPHAR
ncbi:MAG: hypothetical protein RMJ98_20020, partial [Myxococcales bacterium]|nr:hypothetical protein [Polyangiaceae bacterium]MDW8251588.1 hypothetical protein [Myxococcales bacterium]